MNRLGHGDNPGRAGGCPARLFGLTWVLSFTRLAASDNLKGRAHVFSFRRSLLPFIPALAILGACGGSDDDADVSDDADEGSSSPSANNGGATRGSNNTAKVPTIKDGAFDEGTVHIEVSGQKDFKLDAEGNGITMGGFTLLTFANDDATVILTFQVDSKEEPGGVAITATQLSTAGSWGKECTVTAEDGTKELKGEFTCKEVEGVDSKTVKTYKVKVTGKFSVKR